MTDVADLLARAELALADIPDGAGTAQAVVDGIPCVSFPLPYPWATQAKVMSPPRPAALDAALRWLGRHADQWTVMTRRRHVADEVFATRCLAPWLELPALVLGDTRQLARVPRVEGLEVGEPSDAAEFLGVYGPELAPLVTDAVLRAPSNHHLLGRVAGKAVACARIREVAGTAYISGIGVLSDHRGRGFGTAISVAATRLALELGPRVVWLTATEDLHGLYVPMGYRQVDVHVQLRPQTPT